nr:transposase, MuDR, MULE transposase domain protein [Tanacetum cinerariifolium]
GPNRRMEARPSGSSGPTTRSKKRKNTVKAVQDQLQRELEVQISMGKAFRAKAKAEKEIRGDNILQYSMLRDYVVELQSTNPNTTVKIAVERNIDPSLPTRCLGNDIDLHPNLNFTFISDRQKGIIPAIKSVYP